MAPVNGPKKVIIHRYALTGQPLELELDGNTSISEIRTMILEESQGRDSRKYDIDFSRKRVQLYLTDPASLQQDKKYWLGEDGDDLMLETDVLPESFLRNSERYSGRKELDDRITIFDLLIQLRYNEDQKYKQGLSDGSPSNYKFGGGKNFTAQSPSSMLTREKSPINDGTLRPPWSSPRSGSRSPSQKGSSPRNNNQSPRRLIQTQSPREHGVGGGASPGSRSPSHRNQQNQQQQNLNRHQMNQAGNMGQVLTYGGRSHRSPADNSRPVSPILGQSRSPKRQKSRPGSPSPKNNMNSPTNTRFVTHAEPGHGGSPPPTGFIHSAPSNTVKEFPEDSGVNAGPRPSSGGRTSLKSPGGFKPIIGKTDGNLATTSSPVPSPRPGGAAPKRRIPPPTITEVHLLAYVCFDWPRCMREPAVVSRNRFEAYSNYKRSRSCFSLFEGLMMADGIRGKTAAFLLAKASQNPPADQRRPRPVSRPKFKGELFRRSPDWLSMRSILKNNQTLGDCTLSMNRLGTTVLYSNDAENLDRPDLTAPGLPPWTSMSPHVSVGGGGDHTSISPFGDTIASLNVGGIGMGMGGGGPGASGNNGKHRAPFSRGSRRIINASKTWNMTANRTIEPSPRHGI